MERYKEVLLLPRRQFYVHFYVNRAASSPVARDHWGIFELGVMGRGEKAKPPITRRSRSTLLPIIPLSRFSLAREFPNPHLALGKPVEEAVNRDQFLNGTRSKSLPSHDVEIILCCQHQHCFSARYVSGFDVFLIL